jgi:SAM-dependent methyltransferase
MVDHLTVLCCPQCRGELTVACALSTPSSRIKSGVFYCRTCNDAVGAIRNFQCDFVHFDQPACRVALKETGVSGDPLQILPWELVEAVLPFDHPRIRRLGSWEEWDSKYQLSHGQTGDELEYTGEFLDVSVRLLKHPWSGRVRFVVDGEVTGEADLYQPKWSEVNWFPIANDLSPGRHTVRIIPIGERNPLSLGLQVLFHELILTCPGEASQLRTGDVNRVLPVSPEAIELMKEVPPDGLVLDCGCGDRVLADPRYVNIDFTRYQLPKVLGDAMKLPFKSGTFDLVFSQALLEHVPDPFAAVREMSRVAKPGGKLWSGMAFMQPVHAVPSHYFNATAWGIQELFKDLEILDVNWFGELSFTMDWLLKAAGVAEQLDRSEYEGLVEKFKSLDRLVSHEALREVASGVAILARKPFSFS